MNNSSVTFTSSKLRIFIDYYIYKNNKNIFNKNGRRCRDVKTQNVCEQGLEVNVGAKIKQTTSITLHKYLQLQNTKSCTYVGLYGSGLFNFGSYVNLQTLFAYFLGFDIPTSSSIFIENVFIILVSILFSEL